MEGLHQLEIIWILFLQSIGTWLVEPMRLVSMIGNEEFFMIVMPILYWSVDSALGLRVATILLFSNGLNSALKLAFHGSRPYWVSSDIHPYSAESSFGFPSGHAQNAAGIWGFIATRLRSKPGQIALLMLIFLIGFSRVFLGVHYLSDVVAGWVVGGLLVLAVIRLEHPVRAWLSRFSLRQMLMIAFLSSILVGGMVLLAAALTNSWQLPQEWEQNALKADPDETINPLSIEPAFTTAGTWLGLWVGVAWLFHRQGGYRADGTVLQRLIRYLIGLAGIFIFWFVLGQVFPREPNLISYALRFLRYFMVGIWVTGISPLLFAKLGLCLTIEKKSAALTP